MVGLVRVGFAAGLVLAAVSPAVAHDGDHDGATHGASESEAVAPRAAEDDELIQSVAAGRSRFGFDDSIPRAAELAGDAASWDRGQGLGIPVTEAEAELLTARFAVQESMVEVVGDVRGQDGFAGIWLDFNESTVHVATTSPGDAAAAALLNRIDERGTVVMHEVTYTFAELNLIAQRIVDQRIESPAPGGVPVHGGGVDETTNRVLILTDDATRSAEYADALASVVGVAPDMFRFETFEGITDESTAPGGQRFSSCSFGPYGYFDTIYGPIPMATTADHCSDTQYHWSQPTSGFHQPAYRRHNGQNSGNADIQTMYEDDGGLTGWTNDVESWHWTSNLQLTSAPSWGTGHDAVGVIVCQSGHATQGVNNCGTIQSPLSFSCGGFSDMRRADYSSTGTDSGATVYGFVWANLNVPLVGVHKGNCNGKWYTFQSNARAAVGFAGWYLW